MKLRPFALAAALLLFQTRASAHDAPLDATSALQLEHALFSAMTAGDLKALDDLTDPDFLYLHGDAHTDTKTEMLMRMGSGVAKFHSIEIVDNPDSSHDRGLVAFVVPTMAIISSKVDFDVTYKGVEQHAHDRLTTAWRFSQGRWRAVLWQATPFPVTKP
jgi:hypothetical protein